MVTKNDAVIQPCHADAPSFEHGKTMWGDDALFFRIYGGGKYSVGQDFRIYYTVSGDPLSNDGVWGD